MQERSKRRGFLVLVLAGLAAPAMATVFINEVAVNPPGSLDETREFVELQGTPGRKLDGYALALLSGTQAKYYPLNSIPPLPTPIPEIDELFSLDGLSLGANGLLVLAISGASNYPEVLSDTRFVGPWTTRWNGQLDIPGKFENDGSNTIVLIRNRPGRTQADPSNPAGLRWAKSLFHDFERIRPVVDPQDGQMKDQWGDGDVDEGQFNGMSASTLDLLGVSTASVDNDLEIVDEVSYESDRGWEYDFDDRHVDVGSPVPGLPERRVHALDDPQGFNPDILSRVDYRTTGPGWNPASGATGELPGNRNWQDTATEQWVRGESIVKVPVVPPGPEVYFDNAANSNADAIQPYNTNVPRWLNDGVGTNYNFAAANTYRIMAGRVNPLAIPFIPGDADRDGDCDDEDIARFAEVLGEEDWLFINSYAEAPETDEGDPAAQIRPWDVDATGDNGIEPSDLQWTLNFQGNTTGRIVGRRYDSTTPAATGVVLNSNAGVACTVTWATHVLSGHLPSELHANETVELTVSAQVTAGARLSPADQTNGIMQFVHDLQITPGGVIRVESVEAVAPFAVTREDLIAPPIATDRGVDSINGHTTAFDAGLGSATQMYRVMLKTVSLGTAQIDLTAARRANVAASTPAGLKVGRTDQNGNPSSTAYPAPLQLSVVQQAVLPGNCDAAPITLTDYACLADCVSGPGIPGAAPCATFDLDGTGEIDLVDAAIFTRLFGQ